eukprot:2485173-Amphidinium_carterae.1
MSAPHHNNGTKCLVHTLTKKRTFARSRESGRDGSSLVLPPDTACTAATGFAARNGRQLTPAREVLQTEYA